MNLGLPRRLAQLFFGLIGYGFSLALVVRHSSGSILGTCSTRESPVTSWSSSAGW